MQVAYNQFATLSADGATAALALPTAGLVNIDVFLAAAGATFGGGTLALQVSQDGGTTWQNAPSAAGTVTWTSGSASARLGSLVNVRGSHIRFNLTGSTSPTLIVAVAVDQVGSNMGQTGTVSNGGTVALEKLRTEDDGLAYMMVKGTFSSTVVHLQASADGGTTWFSLGSLSAAGVVALSGVKPDWQFRVAGIGGTGTGLTFHVFA